MIVQMDYLLNIFYCFHGLSTILLDLRIIVELVACALLLRCSCLMLFALLFGDFCLDTLTLSTQYDLYNGYLLLYLYYIYQSDIYKYIKYFQKVKSKDKIVRANQSIKGLRLFYPFIYLLNFHLFFRIV